MKVYKGKPSNVRRLAHKMPRKVATKRKYECQDGPLKGQYLWLTDGKTAVFTINGQTGLYDNGEWQQC